MFPSWQVRLLLAVALLEWRTVANPQQQQSPGCNCTKDLLRYSSPAGPCSPECALIGLRHAYHGLGGNDWTLEVSGRQFAIGAAQGRTLWGTTTRKTERLCQATSAVFDGAPAPRRDSPNAPLDVKSCDVMLLEVPVLLHNDAGRQGGPYLRLPARQTSARRQKQVETGPRVPAGANETLREMSRQGWGGAIGVRLVRPEPRSRDLRVEETAAVLDWLLGGCPDLKFAVLDADPREPGFGAYFGVVRDMYGSRVDVMPSMSGKTIARLMSAKNDNATRYACTKTYSECSEIGTLYGEDGRMLHRRHGRRPLLECGRTAPHGRNCTMCQERGTVYALCPTGLRPAEVAEKGSRTPGKPALWLETSRAEEAEAALREAGEVAAQHGALLDLDSWMEKLEGPCKWTEPGRWPPEKHNSVESIAGEAPLGLTGPSVFLELSRRSNNRAGIAVTLPTARYEPDEKCSAMRMRNRHMGKKSSTDRMYSAGELRDIVSDMARWGVSRYSLGYLDHTFGRPEGSSLFAELSTAIDSATRRSGTLHYRYTRSSSFDDGGSSHVEVDGLYKLQSGIFFQRAAENAPLAKGFVTIPGVPGLRLGLSSRMNIGDPLKGGGAQLLREQAEIAESVPVGAQVVKLTSGGKLVAFVEADRIYVHEAKRQGHARLRTQVSRARSMESPLCHRRPQGDHGELECCSRRVREARTRVKLELSVPSATKPVTKARLRKLMDSKRWLPPPVLTRREEEWLSGDGASERTRPAVSWPWRARDQLSLLLECFGEQSGSCLELADSAEGDWPEGATGYPVAARIAVDYGDDILLRILLRADHGAVRAAVPCNLRPFSFGSEGPGDGPQSFPGFFTRPGERVRSASRDYAQEARALALLAYESLALRHCGEASSPLSQLLDCLRQANQSLASLGSEASLLERRARKNDALESVVSERRALAMERSYALCLTAVAVSVLINAAAMGALCAVCSRSRTPRYRKLK
ncbi:uncharacterized protein LOC144987926 [Oryzias latipes]